METHVDSDAKVPATETIRALFGAFRQWRTCCIDHEQLSGEVIEIFQTLGADEEMRVSVVDAIHSRPFDTIRVAYALQFVNREAVAAVNSVRSVRDILLGYTKNVNELFVIETASTEAYHEREPWQIWETLRGLSNNAQHKVDHEHLAALLRSDAKESQRFFDALHNARVIDSTGAPILSEGVRETIGEDLQPILEVLQEVASRNCMARVLELSICQ